MITVTNGRSNQRNRQVGRRGWTPPESPVSVEPAAQTVNTHGVVKSGLKPKTGIDKRGRIVNEAQLAGLTPFQPGQSGNPGGSYKSRPVTDAMFQVARLTVKELKISPDDPHFIAQAKAMAREGLKGQGGGGRMPTRHDGRSTDGENAI
jgi:hypothetical protein